MDKLYLILLIASIGYQSSSVLCFTIENRNAFNKETNDDSFGQRSNTFRFLERSLAPFVNFIYTYFYEIDENGNKIGSVWDIILQDQHSANMALQNIAQDLIWFLQKVPNMSDKDIAQHLMECFDDNKDGKIEPIEYDICYVKLLHVHDIESKNVGKKVTAKEVVEKHNIVNQPLRENVFNLLPKDYSQLARQGSVISKEEKGPDSDIAGHHIANRLANSFKLANYFNFLGEETVEKLRSWHGKSKYAYMLLKLNYSICKEWLGRPCINLF